MHIGKHNMGEVGTNIKQIDKFEVGSNNWHDIEANNDLKMKIRWDLWSTKVEIRKI